MSLYSRKQLNGGRTETIRVARATRAQSRSTASNVADLKQAWIYNTGALSRAGKLKDKIAFEATPIFVDGTLYLSTPLNRVIALDPETGKEKWSYDPDVPLDRRYSEVTSRGVSYWAEEKRIFMGTIDARLICLDARTGKKCTEFGKNGEVDLTGGITIRDVGDYQVTSPPAIVNDVVVVGSSVGDNRAAETERGTVRAYDARTGKLRWSWDPLASLPKTGGANAWSVMSADPAMGLVFVPTGSASPDFYGGERKGDNRYANSVTALRGASGEVVWSFPGGSPRSVGLRRCFAACVDLIWTSQDTSGCGDHQDGIRFRARPKDWETLITC